MFGDQQGGPGTELREMRCQVGHSQEFGEGRGVSRGTSHTCFWIPREIWPIV